MIKKAVVGILLMVSMELMAEQTQQPDPVTSNQTNHLYIGGFFPFGVGDSNFERMAHHCLISTNLAIQHVNEREDVLRDYELHMIYNETKNIEGLAMKQLFYQIYNEPKKIMILGELFSEVTEDLAKVTPYWNLIQVSYGSHSPVLSEQRDKYYKNFFRTIPSSAKFNPARLKMISEFNWKKVATFHDHKADQFQSATSDLHHHLDIHNISVVADSFPETPTDRLHFLKDRDVRIIIGNFNEWQAILIFCEAYKLGMYGRDYVWMIYGYYDPNYLNIRVDEIVEKESGCTLDQIKEAAEGAISVVWDMMIDSDENTMGGISPIEFRDIIKNVTGTDITNSYEPAPYAYDAIWAMALALNSSLDNLTDAGLSLNDFSYEGETGEKMGILFKEKMEDTKFEGVSGPVEFDGHGDRNGRLKIKQIRNGTEILIGIYHASDDTIKWKYNQSFIWERSGGKPPPDSLVMKNEPLVLSRVLFVTMSTLAVLGIIMALAFLAFNIKYKSERLIKMSSPNLNNVTICGCILAFLSLILLGIDIGSVEIATLNVVCQVRSWVFSFGFTLAFGAMFSKTWRVYQIFTNKGLEKRVIKDQRLLAVVGSLLIIDVIILGIWQAIDSQKVIIQNGTKRNFEDNLIQIQEQHYHCSSKYEVYFLAALLSYKFLLLIFGAFITWQTRNVSIPALNDSKYIGLSIYNVFIFSVIGVPLSLILTNHIDASYGMVGSFIFFCTTAILFLLFIPKISKIINGYSTKEMTRSKHMGQYETTKIEPSFYSGATFESPSPNVPDINLNQNGGMSTSNIIRMQSKLSTTADNTKPEVSV